MGVVQALAFLSPKLFVVTSGVVSLSSDRSLERSMIYDIVSSSISHFSSSKKFFRLMPFSFAHNHA